ncbi:hypothetical protein Gmet_2282 [Geobacter metallireducens GS-15]|uniref:Uncharacterized protein n=1 Tax=Geobacter metallireducens (strain ATCC 53774 / DSM 7210 / GS-15) TaxID=269799 RepID=Q39TB7_GEOMG|nr:hypothetical protein Gmet_2282 [Geobacter metallireducens GS-15]
MTESQSHSVRNGVIATVLGGLILSAIPYARGLLLSLIAWVWSGAVWARKTITLSYPTPGWLLLLIGLFALYGAVCTLFALRPKKEPLHKKYTEDIIYGAKWRWSWVGSNVSNLWCYCPTCDATLVYDDSSCRSRYEPSKTDFICERCNGKVVTTIQGGNKSYAVGAAERELLRKVRTGEYVAAIQ